MIHSLRSYAFGIAIAHKVKRNIGEKFFIGSVMHDIGLVEDNIGVDNFEIEKTYVARNFCIHNGMEVSKADLVYEMVALHNSVSIAHKLDPEIDFCIVVL